MSRPIMNFSHFKTGAPDSQPYYSKSEKKIAEIMLTHYLQTLDRIMKMAPVLNYIQEMKRLSKCYGPIVQRDEVLKENSTIVIHFIVKSTVAYHEAYTLRHKHSFPPMMNVYRQVTISKEIEPTWSNTDMEAFVQQITTESAICDTNEKETANESLFFAYHGEIIHIILVLFIS